MDRFEGEFAAIKITLMTLVMLHPKADLMTAGLAHVRQQQADLGQLTAMSDDGLKACDDLLRQLGEMAQSIKS